MKCNGPSSVLYWHARYGILISTAFSKTPLASHSCLKRCLDVALCLTSLSVCSYHDTRLCPPMMYSCVHVPAQATYEVFGHNHCILQCWG